MASGAPQAGSAQQAAPAPAPSHAQTVAALRHFGAVIAECKTLLKNPDLGKIDVRSAIQDGGVKLVADGIISAADAVTQLASVPDKPFDQKKWVEQMFVNAIMAQNGVLDHHRAAHAGTGDYASESAKHPAPSRDSHRDTMRGMMEQHYGR